MSQVYAKEFDAIVAKAKAAGKPMRVALAGADVENILVGLFDAAADGFVEPILIGKEKKITALLDKLGLRERHYELQPLDGDANAVQYAIEMINAGKAGSTYVTYQEAAEEIIAGCVDIANEVADLKMGNPYISSTPEERDYIESPYSCTSTEDFADNIRSIKNAYEGAKAGDYSISNYVYSQNAELDASVRTAIDEAIKAINLIQDFENTAKGSTQVQTAIGKVQALAELLDDEVLALLSK